MLHGTDNMANNTSTQTLLQNYGGLSINNFIDKMQIINSSNHINNDVDVDHESNNLSLYYTIDEMIALFKENPFALKFFSMNAQCLNAKFDQIKSLIEHLSSLSIKLHVICLQETWEKDVSPDFNIHGYKRVATKSRINKCGGLTMFMEDSLDFTLLQDDNIQETYESIFIKIDIPIAKKTTKSFVVGNIYRPPREDLHNYERFIEEFTSQLRTLTSKC